MKSQYLERAFADFRDFAAGQSSVWLTEPWPGEEGRRARQRERERAYTEALHLLHGDADPAGAWERFGRDNA